VTNAEQGQQTGEVTRIVIDLPTPAHMVSDRGFKYLDDFDDTHERSHAERAMVQVNDELMTVREAEDFALAVLWLVRNHYHGEGLACEVATQTIPVPIWPGGAA
jgi:hypothetical protein